MVKVLEDMEKDDLIELARGPTSWISEMLAFSKPGKPEELRVVLDSRQKNKAILREGHNMPTVKELAAQLNGAKVITKIDLKGRFHQILLHPDSRYITTFRTPKGLMWYKRLSMGINCASEMFQHIIEEVLAGIKGVRNMIDDIIVFGEDEEPHDKRLYEVLKMLNELGLTLGI